MYRIMLVNKEGVDEVNHLYKFFSVSNADGKLVVYEAETLEELDAQIEKMINGNYRKKDILVVQTKGFEVTADIHEVATEDPGTVTE